MPWFYDNQCNEPDEARFVEVERVYCFDFDTFQEPDWLFLGEVCDRLPDKQPDTEECPFWFGSNESIPPFLWASVEPPGLHVYGILTLDQWQRWDEEFRRSTINLPPRKITGSNGPPPNEWTHA